MRLELMEHSVWRSDFVKSSDTVTVFEEQNEHLLHGTLKDAAGQWYPIIDGVPCFLTGDLRPDLTQFESEHGLSSTSDRLNRPVSSDHTKTINTFSDKWRRFQNYGLEADQQAFLFEWYCKKLGQPDLHSLRQFYSEKQCILEVGPGSGFNSRFIAEHTSGNVYAADISDAALTTFKNTRHLPNCHVIQADLMDLPFKNETFDFIIADGVLHHTPDTRESVRALYDKLRPGGQFFFYVYKRMGAARQFCDRHINAAFSQLPPDECYRACEGLTELGRELSHLGAKITLKTGIPILGIPAGEHDLQRLIYYNFLKCFWNEAFDWETNNMVNFDWYHPVYAWQHTEEDVVQWMNELDIPEYTFHPANPNGLSVLLRKPEGTKSEQRAVA